MFTCPAGKCFSNHEPVSCTHTGGSRAGGDNVLVELPDQLDWGHNVLVELPDVAVSPGEQKRLAWNEGVRILYENEWRRQRERLAHDEMVRNAPRPFHHDAIV